MKFYTGILAATLVLTGGQTMALTVKDRTLAQVACEAARGNLGELERAYAEAFAAGWTVQEMKEVATQAYAYCGFPRSLNALATLMKVAPDKAPGVNPSRPDGDSLVRGTKVQTELCGGPVKGALFDFAPAIDDYLKAHLFGDIFGRGVLSWREREMATVAMLSALGNVRPQLDAHIGIAKRNGVDTADIQEILALVDNEKTVSAFELGELNPYAKYFSGRSWLKHLTTREVELGVPVWNVTFEPGCRNNWHSHTGGQMLIGVGGVGYYQARGGKPVRILPGTVVEIPANVDHWHGAAPDSWFSHLAIETNPKTNKNTWLEPVSDADYAAATKRD